MEMEFENNTQTGAISDGEITENTGNDFPEENKSTAEASETEGAESKKDFNNSPKRDSFFANQRRKEENRALKDRMESFAKKNGYESFAEMERLHQKKERESFSKEFEESTGLSFEAFEPVIQRAIENNPAVIEANRITQSQKEADMRKEIEHDLSEISALSGFDIKNFEDLTKLPNFEEFDDLAGRGFGLLRAFKATHTDLLIENASKKASQKTLNSINSKGHLEPSKGGGGANDVFVPEDVKEYYRSLNPGVTDEEITKHYAKNHK